MGKDIGNGHEKEQLIEIHGIDTDILQRGLQYDNVAPIRKFSKMSTGSTAHGPTNCNANTVATMATFTAGKYTLYITVLTQPGRLLFIVYTIYKVGDTTMISPTDTINVLYK